MTLSITGRGLSRDDVVRVARRQEPVELAAEARDRMDRSRAVVEGAIGGGATVYGTTTAVGALRKVGVAAAEGAAYSSWMLAHHLVGQGPDAPPDVVRATILRLANHLAEGSPGVRPAVAASSGVSAKKRMTFVVSISLSASRKSRRTSTTSP